MNSFDPVAFENDETFKALFRSIRKKEKVIRRFRLYINKKPESLLACAILRDVCLPVETVRVPADFLYCYGKKCFLPILVDIQKGSASCSIFEVKNRARCFALSKSFSSKRECYFYYPYNIDFENNGWYRDEMGNIQRAEVWCFNENNELLFLGKIKDAPYPVLEMLKAHWYVKKNGRFHDLVVWNLGCWLELEKRVNEKGHLIQRKPPAVLFVDEIELLKKTKKDNNR
jgi:hypothetical protein